MLKIIAINHFAWSIIWIVVFLFQESDYFFLSNENQALIDMGINIFHMVSLLLIIIFYFQSIAKRKHLKIKHAEQKFWLIVGGIAALANILKNMYSESLGLNNLIAFIPATIQNTLVYFASIWCIMILDGWNMEHESRMVKNSVWLLIISQIIINLTLIIEGCYSYINPQESDSFRILFFLTVYRSWLIYFGGKKVQFLIRKARRWNCELFTYALVYVKLEEIQYEEEPPIVRAVSARVTDVDSLLYPLAIEYTDPSFHIQSLSMQDTSIVRV